MGCVFVCLRLCLIGCLALFRAPWFFLDVRFWGFSAPSLLASLTFLVLFFFFFSRFDDLLFCAPSRFYKQNVQSNVLEKRPIQDQTLQPTE